MADKRRRIFCKICNEEAENKGYNMCSKCYSKNRPKKICHICGTIAIVSSVVGNKPVCKKCYEKNRPKEKCHSCKEFKTIAYRKTYPLCAGCRRKERGVKEECCSMCDKLKTINARDENKSPICSNCYVKNIKKKEKCSSCCEIKTVVYRHNDNPVCSICYRKKHRPKKICSQCMRKSIVIKYDNYAPICGTCYKNQNIQICSVCNVKNIVGKTIDNKYICGKCYMRSYTRPKKTCGECGETKTIEKIYNNVLLCSSCHRKLPEVATKYFNNRQKYRVRKNNSGEISTQQWLSLMKSSDWKCFYCKSSISAKKNRTIDHVVPISKGGKTEINNLVPCCHSCNASKNDSNVKDWLEYKKYHLSNEKLIKLGIT